MLLDDFCLSYKGWVHADPAPYQELLLPFSSIHCITAPSVIAANGLLKRTGFCIWWPEQVDVVRKLVGWVVVVAAASLSTSLRRSHSRKAGLRQFSDTSSWRFSDKSSWRLATSSVRCLLASFRTGQGPLYDGWSCVCTAMMHEHKRGGC